jgi:hypothetical protein
MRLEGLIIPVSFDQGGFDTSLSGIKSKLVNFGADAAALGMVAGIGTAYVDFMISTIKPAADAETANMRLATALQASGRNAETSAPQLGSIATHLASMSTFSDEDILAAFQTMTSFSQVPTTAFESVAQMAIDMAAYGEAGGSVVTNVEGIGKALESGIIPRTWDFTEAQKQQFAALWESGSNADRLSFIMDALNKKYGGQAAAELGTYNGKVKDLNDKWGEFKEQIGSGVLPAITALIDFMNRNFDTIVKWLDAITNVLFLWKGAGALSKSIAENVQSGWTGAPRVPTGNAWQQAFGSAQQNQGAQQSIDYYKFASILAAEIAKSQ